MRKFVQLLSGLFLTVVFPFSAFAQETIVVGDLDTYIAMLELECPIEYSGSWTVSSFNVDCDTVYVELRMPSSLGPFLPKLTGDDYRAKRLWFRQLKTFGYPWEDLLGRLIDEERYLVITFKPESSKITAVLTISPEEFKSLANNEEPPSDTPMDSESDDGEEVQPDE